SGAPESRALYPSLLAATDKSPDERTRKTRSPRSVARPPTPAEPPSAGSLPASCDQAFAHRVSWRIVRQSQHKSNNVVIYISDLLVNVKSASYASASEPSRQYLHPH